jgi:hypothetical protein
MNLTLEDTALGSSEARTISEIHGLFERYLVALTTEGWRITSGIDGIETSV